MCDGLDNNCNGVIDELEEGRTWNDMCGGAPFHGSFKCELGVCEIDSCESGWTRFPASTPAVDGCGCRLDDADKTVGKNNTCPDVTDKGTIRDSSFQAITIEGTLHSTTDEDWYSFKTEDYSEPKLANSYRVNIKFTANPADEYLFDVIRVGSSGSPCSVAAKTRLTSYDWCGKQGASGADDVQTSDYRLRVYRAPSASSTCSTYKIRVQNGGTGSCPAADACGA
jgi:hypothetical protein